MERGGARPALRPARLRSELDRVLSGAVQLFSGSSVQRLPMFFFFFISSLHIRAARVPGLSVRSGTKVEQGSFRLRCCNISPSLLQPFSMINKSGLNSENPTSTYVFAHSKQTVPIAPDGIQVLS